MYIVCWVFDNKLLQATEVVHPAIVYKFVICSLICLVAAFQHGMSWAWKAPNLSLCSLDVDIKISKSLMSIFVRSKVFQMLRAEQPYAKCQSKLSANPQLTSGAHYFWRWYNGLCLSLLWKCIGL